LAPEAVLEAMDAVGGRQLPSLDAPTLLGLSLSGAASNDDRDLGGVEQSMAVSALLKRLRPEDERVIRMRFGLGMSQREIARALGRSQMQISRTLARSLKRLRLLAGAEALYAE
jgi:RNA polymerase sigma-B factor